MERSSPVDSVQYLDSKRSVDDRALNERVWRTVWQELTVESPRVLELGCGIGTMVERILETGVLPAGSYTGLDLNPAYLAEARRRLPTWARKNGLQARSTDGASHLQGASTHLTVRFQQADLTEDLSDEVGQDWDLLLANAVLDLVPLDRTLPLLLDLLGPRGVFYFSITFDGVTSFQPTVEKELDRTVMRLYHQSMDDGEGMSGSSQSGRALLGTLQELGTEILAAGGSDWIVHPVGGEYLAEERSFLGTLLDTVEHALRNHPRLAETELQRWLAARRRQLDRAELILLTHQLDVCGRP